MDFKRMEMASRVTFNWFASCCWVWASSSNNACNSLSSNFFGDFRSHVFVSHVKIATFEFFKPLKALWFTKSMLTVNFDKHSILQQFSSNSNRKSMLSANCNFQAQNSTCSTLLQTILLYETCIVVSWKSLSDVRTKKWRQWRRLTVTTLTAMAILVNSDFIFTYLYMTFHSDLPYTTKQFTTNLTDVTLTSTTWLLWSNKFRASLLKDPILVWKLWKSIQLLHPQGSSILFFREKTTTIPFWRN